MLVYPRPGLSYRTIGPIGGRTRRLGVGVVDKSGVTTDFIDLNPPTWSLVWVLRGSGSYVEASGRMVSLAAGDVFQRWPGRTHSSYCDPASDWLEVFLDLGPAMADALVEFGALRRDLVMWHLGQDPIRLQRWLRLRDALAVAPDHDLPRLLVELQGEAVDAMAVNRVNPGQDLIDAACQYLADSTGGRDDLREFCRAHALGYEAFRKRFQRRVGLSPGQYRIRRRLERASALLQTTRRSIADIASELGYASPFEFSAQFHRHLGIRPRDYRGR